MRTWVRVSLFLMLTLVLSLSGLAQGRGRPDRSGGERRAVVEINPDVERMIREWFGNTRNLEGLPPGLERDQLPPGLQRQLERRGSLPPGLEKKIHPVPEELQIRLPRFPDQRRWIVLGGNVILLDETTSTILDIVEGVF